MRNENKMFCSTTPDTEMTYILCRCELLKCINQEFHSKNIDNHDIFIKQPVHQHIAWSHHDIA